MFKRCILFLTIFISWVFADVVMHTPSQFYGGEPVVFSLEASGSNIEFPVIDDIEGFLVSKHGSSSSLSILNGQRTQKIIQQYSFFPNRTVLIPKFKITIDGQSFHTQSKEVKKIEAKKTQSEYIDFTLTASKTDLYIGEQSLFTLIFKYRRDLQIVDLGFTSPNFQGFWSKQIGEAKKYEEGMFVVQELKYILFPQKSGKLTIPSLKVDVSVVDSRSNGMSFFGPPTRIEKVYSNELKFNVKAIPENLSIIGDFVLKENIDKKTIDAGEALTYNIEINGRGNLDDIPELKILVPNATIYDNKATKEFDMIDGKYGGIYKKSFSIVANENFRIPSVVIKYFDIKENRVKELKTKEYTIEVKKKIQKDSQLYKQQSSTQGSVKEIVKVINASTNEKLLYFFFGCVLSILIFGLTLYVIKLKGHEKQEELPLEKEVKSTNNVHELLNVLLSYINVDKNLDKMIYEIENRNNVNFKQIKKDIIKIIKEKDIK